MRARDWQASDMHVCCALAKGAANALARTWRGMRCVGASHAVSRGAYEVTRAGEARLGDAAERRGARFESCKLVLLAATLVLYVV